MGGHVLQIGHPVGSRITISKPKKHLFIVSNNANAHQCECLDHECLDLELFNPLRIRTRAFSSCVSQIVISFHTSTRPSKYTVSKPSSTTRLRSSLHRPNWKWILTHLPWSEIHTSLSIQIDHLENIQISFSSKFWPMSRTMGNKSVAQSIPAQYVHAM